VQGLWQGWTLTFGLDWELLDEDRRGYENFALQDGQTLLGVQGRLRRDERNRVASVDPYVQGERSFGDRWRLLPGLRGSTVRFESSDRYLANGDDSGSVRYRAVTPTLGVVYRLSASGSNYGSYGRGFETPTLNEIAYRADGRARLNGDVEPAHSNSVELGLKSALGAKAAATLALFSTTTRDDLVVLANSGGRSAFGNAGATSRRRSVDRLAARRTMVGLRLGVGAAGAVRRCLPDLRCRALPAARRSGGCRKPAYRRAFSCV